jgi:hypothetical protein
VNLLRKAMERAAPGGGGRFLVDGFPRNFDNLDGWHRVMGDKVRGALLSLWTGRTRGQVERAGRSNARAGRTRMLEMLA